MHIRYVSVDTKSIERNSSIIRNFLASAIASLFDFVENEMKKSVDKLD